MISDLPGPRPLLWYRLDAKDRLLEVGGEWDRFAIENGAPGLVRERLLGASLWDHVHGVEVQMIYRDLFGSLRRAQKNARLRFRCDSPEKRRELVMIITPDPARSLHVLTKLIEERPHEAAAGGLPSSVDRRLLTICSNCKQLRVDGGWMEVVEALRLHSFGLVEGVALSHGLCPVCVTRFEEEIDRL